ncbi:Glycosyltransferase involved in cell wall bisynthesis [Nostoc flagelliforme CCNUN1]|uniref:Glycosyltransferase involved in cell wall bisynthesis n=1 Tax=Nostoc flagelliforme CCNUN1 TaxID=2038116 RepID=A0A2K8SY85_9NOSO|nr:glycosyltransferase family 1 protein [Nostoc flagelliforme]AUB40392.1 Glycosyltransferase involved in cell wall bisynthesis [Nostoc flagelliforme CCNUN1]
MRIFIDCTHTAKHRYKNTGIHRVVRELTSELLQISSNRTDTEIVAVIFDGSFMRRVTNLNQQQDEHFMKINKYLDLTKINIKIQALILKLKNKFINFLYVLNLIDLLDSNLSSRKTFLEFEGSIVQPEDIYVIADANWDLPKTYYRFLQLLKRHKVTIIVICYDLIPIKFPEFSSKKFTKIFTKFYSDYSILFDKVLCISKKSAEDYSNAINQGILAKNNSQIVQSFRLGSNYYKDDLLLSKEPNSFDENLQKLLNKKYILVVGSLVPHKNIKTVIAAFDLLINSIHDDVFLVFAGNKGWDSETDKLIESNKMYGKLIQILGSVTDAQLDFLYQNCYCLVQASFYEGFGLPVVEALQHCKPVIASNGGSLPEVGGNFCRYFSPTQPTELYEALKELLDSDIYYNNLVDRIRNEYISFSWQESAKEFLSRLYN